MKYLVAVLSIAIVCIAGWVWFQNRSTPGTPYYGRALFGNDATDSQAWQHFIVQGDQVFVDQDRDAVADSSEVFDSSSGLKFSVGNREYSIVAAQAGVDADAVSESLPQRLQLEVDVHGVRPYRMAGKMLLTHDPDDCNWLHFGGELQFLVMDPPRLRAGAKTAAELKIFIGTPTSGPLTQNDMTTSTSSSQPDVFRTAIVIPVRQSPYPSLELAFDLNGTMEPAPQQLVMDQFC